MVLHTSLYTQFIHIFSLLLYYVALNLPQRCRSWDPKQSDWSKVIQLLWKWSCDSSPCLSHSGDKILPLFHKAQHPHDTYLALDENTCDSSCLCVGRQNQKASLALLGTTLHRMPAAGSFPLNSTHTAQSPPAVWLLVVCYLVFSRLWFSEQIASSSPGRENIPQRRIIQIRNIRLLHPVKTDWGELGLIQCKY